jgi:cell division protein ZapA
MPEKRPVRVTIFNQSYSFLAEGDPAEVEAAALTVDELLTSLAARSSYGDSARIAVLACLHLADRLRRVEGEFASLRRKTEKIGELLETAFSGNDSSD